jgi:hypothetical protein
MPYCSVVIVPDGKLAIVIFANAPGLERLEIVLLVTIDSIFSTGLNLRLLERLLSCSLLPQYIRFDLFFCILNLEL